MKTINVVMGTLYVAFLLVTLLISETASESLFLGENLLNILLYCVVLAGGVYYWGNKEAEMMVYGLPQMARSYSRIKKIFLLIVLCIAVGTQVRFFVVHCWPLLVL